MKYLIVLALLCSTAVAATDPAGDLRAAFRALVASGGFRGHASGQVFGPGLPSLEGEVDVLFPDRIHVRSGEIEFIRRGDRGWIRTLGFWAPTDPALLPVTAFDMARVREAIDAIRDVRVEGTAVTRQCRARVYRFHSEGNLPSAVGEGEGRAWVCDGSHRIARVQVADGHGGQTVTFDFDGSRRPSVAAPE